MLTPLQLRQIYIDTVKELNPNDWPLAQEQLREDGTEETDEDILDWIGAFPYPEVNENSSLSQEQWNNLVDVCHTIKENEKLFDMEYWHEKKNCGTTHCIAGWAVALYLKNPNFDDHPDLPEFVNSYDFSNCTVGSPTSINATATLGTVLLSEYISPFFYLVEDEDGDNSSSVIMKNLIEVVLAEAATEVVEPSNKEPWYIRVGKKLFGGLFS